MPATPHDSLETTLTDGIRELESLYLSGADDRVIARTAALIDLAPDLYPLYMFRGSSFKRVGETEQAIACFRKVLELKPGESGALVKIGLCLQAVGRVDEAVPYLAENFYLRPTKDAGELVMAALQAGTIDAELVNAVMREIYRKFFDRDSNLEVRELPLMEIATWCEKHRAPAIEYKAAGEVRLVDMDNVPLAPYRVNATYFFVVPGAAVMAGSELVMAPTGEALYNQSYSGPAPSILAGNGAFVPGATFNASGNTSRDAAGRVFHPWTKDVIEIDEDALFLGAPRLHHFGHWIYDYLPKLRVWRQNGRAPLKIFTMANLPAAQREALTLFGVRTQDLIEGETGKVYRFKSLTVGTVLSLYSPVPGAARFLYQALAIQKTPLPVGSLGEAYYLERSQTARGRAVANYEQLAATLAEFQVRTVRRPEFSIAQQNALFSEAGIVICPFGTDVVTVFQARPGTDFVFLQFKDLESIYEGIAEHPLRYCAILGMRAHVVECQLIAQDGKIGYHGDMIVDCAALRRTLTKIQARRRAES